MKVGVGYCNNRDAFCAGRSGVTDAIRRGAIDRPDLVMAFCSGQLEHEAFLQGINEIVGETPVIGGDSIGIITNHDLSYTGFPTGVAVFQFDTIKYQIAAIEDLDSDEYMAGCNLASQLSETEDDKLLLMFYDSIKFPASPTSPPVMNASSPLIEGLQSILQPGLLIAGAGLLGNYQFSNSTQFSGSGSSQQSAVTALISGSIKVYHTITHGCSPLDGIYRTITKMQGSVINKLDDQPIVEIIDEIYRDQDWRKQQPLNLLTIGVNYGERLTYQEDKYVNRLITGILPDCSGIGMFEPDLEEGTEIQFMLRDGNKMISSARLNAERLMKKIIDDERTPLFALYIDCAGRAAEQSNTETEEAAEIQQVMNRHNTPLLGFYSGVEVAPILGKSKGLDWTGVLMVLAKDN